jgi:DNA (cytosine-5)-methyltransferase 1
VNKLRVLDLFSGIGGFSLGLERAKHESGPYNGFETVAFCEIEAFPRKVLAKHWPDVPCYDDVRTLTDERLAADGIAVDVICGGFPCQDISTAGSGAGLAGERSGLWSEIARLVGELAPRFVIVENVAALLSRGLGDVLGDLAALGYDAEWHCIPASSIGALHRRDRVWIVAYPRNDGHRPDDAFGEDPGSAGQGEGEGHQRQRVWPVAGGSGKALADAAFMFRNGSDDHAAISVGKSLSELRDNGGAKPLADSERGRRQGPGQSVQSGNTAPIITRQAVDAFYGRVAGEWATEPNVGRVANGVPDRAHRLKALGNAVVPQIPELIGNAILEALA